MQIQIGVTQRMKLYNVYRICKKYIDFIDNIEVSQRPEKINSYSREESIYIINNWLDLKEVLSVIAKIPALNSYATACILSIPNSVMDYDSPSLLSDRYNKFMQSRNVLYSKMDSIIELYESMNIGNGGNGIDIKVPSCEDLKEYISYLKEINFIFSQCPFLQCENEILKFESVDVGSNWLRLTIATASTCVILSNIASLVGKALVIRSHYITIQQQEEMLKSAQLSNELSKEQIELFNSLRDATMNTYIKQLEEELGNLDDPEERDRAERSIEKLILLIDKGAEIHATLDSPEDIQALFPEIQGSLELPDNVIKYLEEKVDE